MSDVVVEIKRLDRELPVPRYQHLGDAGLDLHSAETIELPAGERRIIGTGIAVTIPDGFFGLVAPRSGLAARSGLAMVNSPGVVDSGYRGEIKLVLVNLDPREAISIKRGDRVAQLLIVPVTRALIVECEELDSTDRGDAGLGSTGV